MWKMIINLHRAMRLYTSISVSFDQLVECLENLSFNLNKFSLNNLVSYFSQYTYHTLMFWLLWSNLICASCIISINDQLNQLMLSNLVLVLGGATRAIYFFQVLSIFSNLMSNCCIPSNLMSEFYNYSEVVLFLFFSFSFCLILPNLFMLALPY